MTEQQPTVPFIIDAPGLGQLAQHLDRTQPTIDLTPAEGETIHDGGELVAPDLDQFLAETDAPYDWVVPDILETGDRAIVTGGEGAGKSTLCRQFGVQVASGIHPFTLDTMSPRRVLLIDCENSVRQLRRKLPPLRATAALAYRTGHFRIRVAPNGLDLNRTEHVNHLIDVIAANRPEILLIGPIYKMISGDPTAEAPAREVSRVLDRIRNQFGCALLIEAHSPYPENARAARPMRPYGASLWSRWPEFGIHLADNGVLGHWRGPRDERNWPARLMRATDTWPWIVAETSTDWEGPTHCIDAVVALLTEITPGELTSNQVVSALRERGSSFQKQTVLSALKIAAERDKLASRSGPRGSVIYRTPDSTQGMLETDEDDETF